MATFTCPFGLAKKKFKDLSLAEFVYGYFDFMRVASDEQQEVMSTHLMALMRLAAKYKWLSVLSFHAAVVDRIEAGLASWGDDFPELKWFNITESDRLPLATKQQNQPTIRPPGFTPKTYYKEWNRTSTCSNQSHQVGTKHACAYCKLPNHTIASCPTRLTTINASPAAGPSSAWLRHQPDTDDVKFPSSLQSPNKITTNTNPPVSSVNTPCCSSPLSAQADCASPLTKSLPRGRLNLSASHSISAVIRHIICCKHTRPNAFGTRIVVPSHLNLPAWQASLANYHDPNVALFFAHGWPVNYCLSSYPEPFDSNHSSAANFAQTVNGFIETVLSHEATAGPFKHDPIPSRRKTSLLQTVNKDKTKHCFRSFHQWWYTQRYLAQCSISLDSPSLSRLCKSHLAQWPWIFFVQKRLKTRL